MVRGHRPLRRARPACLARAAAASSPTRSARSRRRARSTSPAAPATLTQLAPRRDRRASTRARDAGDRRASGSRTRRSSRATRSRSRSRTDSFERVVTILLRPSRGRRPRALPRRGAPRRARARRRRRRPPRGHRAGGAPGARPQRRLELDGLQALLHRGRARRGARRRRDRCTRAAGSSSSARRGDALPLGVPLARLAPARQPGVPRLRRGRLPARVAADRPAVHRPALLHVRAGARRPGRRSSASPGAAAPARRCAAGWTWRRTKFYATFYCASVTRCYPGRQASGRGDRTPTPREQELCAFWRDWELELMRPALIVPVGGLAIRHLLGPVRLADCIGQRFDLNGAVAIPLPHPSGASSWLNHPANRERVAARGARDPGRARPESRHAFGTLPGDRPWTSITPGYSTPAVA